MISTNFKRIIFIVLMVGPFSWSSPLFSQAIRLVSATCQRWAGGICCRSGINYHIQLKVAKRKALVKLDSLWMNGNCVDISKYNDHVNNKTSSLITLRESVSRENGMTVGNECFDETKTGVVISYYLNGGKKLMDITPYIKELEFQAYP